MHYLSYEVMLEDLLILHFTGNTAISAHNTSFRRYHLRGRERQGQSPPD
jgi:hypothetical protein